MPTPTRIEDDREDLADVIEWLHLAEADGRDGCDRLVHGVEHENPRRT